MDKIRSFIIAFILVFIFYLIFVVFNKKKVSQIFDSRAAKIMSAKFKLTFKDQNKKLFAFILAFTDSFICAITYTIMQFIENVYLKFIVAFLCLGIFIIVFYLIIGYFYKKKEVKQHL